MSKIGKGFIVVGLSGFTITAVLLLTGHWGVAVKTTNYLFFVLFAGILYEIFILKS